MLPDDTYRSKLNVITQQFDSWAQKYKDSASIETTRVDGIWRIESVPKTFGACPFELAIRDDQKFDIALGEELYEDRAIESIGALELFPKLAQAIACANIVQRRRLSASTNLILSTETEIRLPDSGNWTDAQILAPEFDRESDDLIIEETHFLPYKRA